MPEIVGALIGALAVIFIPLVAWSSRRLTKENRLIVRIERLGAVHALMPESPEKVAFQSHLNQVVADLNEWLDESNKKRRSIQLFVSTSAYFVGAVAVIAALPFTSPEEPWRGFAIGTVIGILLGGITLGTSLLLERSARQEKEQKKREATESEEAARFEALRANARPTRNANPAATR